MSPTCAQVVKSCAIVPPEIKRFSAGVWMTHLSPCLCGKPPEANNIPLTFYSTSAFHLLSQQSLTNYTHSLMCTHSSSGALILYGIRRFMSRQYFQGTL